MPQPRRPAPAGATPSQSARRARPATTRGSDHMIAEAINPGISDAGRNRHCHRAPHMSGGPSPREPGDDCGQIPSDLDRAMRSAARHTRALWARGRVRLCGRRETDEFRQHRPQPSRIRQGASSVISEVRRLFSADEIRTHLARLEREQAERDAETRENLEEDEFPDETPAEAELVRQFATIKDLLTADTLGTS